MNLSPALSNLNHTTLAGLLALSVALPPVTPQVGMADPAAKPACVLNFIGHETTDERTRVILHASAPIDYRGGSLHGNQVILDIANVENSLPSTVIEVGSPEVDRVVIGPEIHRDNDRVLKVRLLGVRASTHKVEPKGNELYIDLTPVKGARDQKGMPKVIDNRSETTAMIQGRRTTVAWAKATPVDQPEEAPVSMAETTAAGATAKKKQKMMAIPAGQPAVTKVPAETAPAETAQGSTAMAEMPVMDTPMQDTPAETMEGKSNPETTATMPASQPAPPATTAAGPMTAQPAVPAPASVLPMAAANESGQARALRVAVGRSLTLDTGVPVARVSVSNPAVAEPVAISPTQLLINGLAPGVVSMVLWPKQGPAIVYELVVHIDTTGLAQQIETIFPNEHVRVQASKDSIVLSGTVTDPAVAEKMVKLAGDYSARVVNDMNHSEVGRRQIMLKVKFAEVSKTAMTELATMWTHVDPQNPFQEDRGNAGTGQFVPPFGNLINLPPGPDTTWSDAINLSYFDKRIDLGLFITALKTRGLFQELAEPTLMAASGEAANFLAGGEFPVPIAQPGANFVAITVEWKKFGIMLDFKPTITNGGTIVMKVKPEVSSLDFSNGVQIQGFNIPSLIVRRAETEVELRDGQSFAIAGLYDKSLLQSKQRIPLLGDIPILGYLFRSKAIEKKQAELLVIVTPTIVKPMGSEAEHPTLVYPEPFELDKPAKKK